MKHAKMFAILAVAVFCASAFAIAIDTTDSSADGEKLTYSFYLELNDGTNKYSGRLADIQVDGTAPSGSTYATALAGACTAAGFTAVFSGSYLLSITANAVTYAGSGTWGQAGYKDFAVYYDDGGNWKTSALNDKTMLIIVYGEYLFSEPSDASKYYKNEMEGYDPYWTPLPAVEMVEYKVFFDLKDGDSSYSKWITSRQPGISGESLKSARYLGAKEAGFTVENNAKYATSLKSITADNHTYKSHGEYPSTDYWNFSAYCKDGDKNEWKDLQSADLNTATIVAHVFNKYAFEDPKDSSYYYHAPVGSMDAYWTKLPSESPEKSSGNNNLVLYIAIGVVAVVAVAAVVFFVMKKKA